MLGTKSMPTFAAALRTCASCPAPLVMSRGGTPDRSTAAGTRTVVLADRALLDVELDEHVDVATHRAREVRRIQTDGAHAIGERDAIRVAHALRLVRLEAIRDRPRSPEVRVEAASFFFADGDALEDPRRPAVALPEAGDRLDPRNDAEGAIERAAAANGVDVR